MSSQLIAENFIKYDVAKAYWYGLPKLGGVHINSERVLREVENFHHRMTWGTQNGIFKETVLAHDAVEW